MITFDVVKEEHGWAIRMGERMTTPFWSRDLAIREANCLADAIRGHGECAEVFVEGADQGLKLVSDGHAPAETLGRLAVIWSMSRPVEGPQDHACRAR
jgi:hypothetical protein